MKDPKFIIFNDIHLKTGNEGAIYKAVQYMVKYCTENKIANLVFAGDLFDSRSFQRQSVLLTFDKILSMISNAGLTLYIFPGNHDKTLYDSEDSFLEVYRHYPFVHFNRTLKKVDINGISVSLLPYFTDDILHEELEEAEGSDLLIAHLELAGSSHLGRVSEKKTLPRKLFKKFKKVYLGHYHNTHEITKDIIHLPSMIQNDFGEDDNKGFSVIYDDLSYEIIRGKFRTFEKIMIDLDTVTIKEVKELTTRYQNNPNSIRFEFKGEESKLKALDLAQFRNTGIDIKVKHTLKYDLDAVEMPKIINGYNKDKVKESFKVFCKEKDYDFKIGSEMLNEFLDK